MAILLLVVAAVHGPAPPRHGLLEVPAMVSKLFVLLALAVALPDDIELGLSAETFAVAEIQKVQMDPTPG